MLLEVAITFKPLSGESKAKIYYDVQCYKNVCDQ